MARKGFCVNVHLELHAITCPGVWLCPNGKVALRITTLGSTLESHRVSPIFPLLFHNEFNFKKTFTRLAALTELQRNLEQEFLYAELIQWLCPCNQPVLLATFEASLADVLYPVVHRKRLLAGVDVDLLMDPSKYFPGIIAPKIQVSTKTVIEEVTFSDASQHRAYVVNPKTIDSKRRACAYKRHPAKGIIRQRKVCHSRGKKDRDASGYRCLACSVAYSCQGDSPRTDRCYHPTGEQCISKRLESDVYRPSKNQRIPSVCRNLRIFDNCPICLKYRCYFSCECEHAPGEKSIGDPADSREYQCRPCGARASTDKFHDT